MPSLFKTVVAALAVAATPALAELSVTAPIASTKCTGGQTCQVSWNDNGRGVTLAQQGNMTIALYTGGAQQQTFLQPIAYPEAVNVSTTSAVVFTVDPTIGPNGADYFIRFSSTSLNQNNSANPYLSFSAKFTLEGMSGTFNSSVQAQISSASSNSQTSTGSPTGTTTRASGTSSSRSATATNSTGGALKNSAAGALAAGVAVVAGVVAMF